MFHHGHVTDQIKMGFRRKIFRTRFFLRKYSGENFFRRKMFRRKTFRWKIFRRKFPAEISPEREFPAAFPAGKKTNFRQFSAGNGISAGCSTMIGTHYDLIQSPRSEILDEVFDSSVLYKITNLK